MSEEYKLTTIKDIFEKVPADRIQDCCKELGVLLAQAAGMRDLVCAYAEEAGIEVGDSAVKIPDEFTWMDDGKGDLTLRLMTDEDTEIGILNTQIEV